MATTKTTTAKTATSGRRASRNKPATKKSDKFDYCSMPVVPVRQFPPSVNPHRANLILRSDKKWTNGTILHYYFFDKSTDGEEVFFSDGSTKFVKWTGNQREKDIVRQAFDLWKKVGIGLEFKEVNSRDDAEIRIGFMRGDGAWSYVGRDILGIGRNKRTMNFGWDLTRPGELDTALHEIGHTLGFPHEHQNPNAGIVWDEQAVIDSLAKPPNNWSKETTIHNIIRKIDPDLVQGSNWDPDSIMHYPFGPGLIIAPEKFKNGLQPRPGLSARDKAWVKNIYPPLKKTDYTELVPFNSVALEIAEGQQRNFLIVPKSTRKYDIRTFGISDTVMVLFEDVNGELRYRTGDDDSGEDYNASFRIKLYSGRKYVLRIRLYYKDRAGETAIMMW